MNLINNTIKSLPFVLFTIIISSCYQGNNSIHVSHQTSKINSESQTFKSIQEAVNSAKPDQIIYIHKGIYREQIKIPKDHR